jgi:hypothetical protein
MGQSRHNKHLSMYTTTAMMTHVGCIIQGFIYAVFFAGGEFSQEFNFPLGKCPRLIPLPDKNRVLAPCCLTSCQECYAIPTSPFAVTITTEDVISCVENDN